MREGADRYGKRKSHARPDRIIEKRPNWQDYLDPEEDPGLLEEGEPADIDEEAEEKDAEEEERKPKKEEAK